MEWAARGNLTRIVKLSDRAFDHRPPPGNLWEAKHFVLGSGSGHKRSVQTAGGGLDLFFSDRILNHLREKVLDEVGSPIAKVVKSGSARLEAAARQLTAVIVLGTGGPFHWRTNALQDQRDRHRERTVGPVRLRVAAAIGVVESLMIGASDKLLHSLHMIVIRPSLLKLDQPGRTGTQRIVTKVVF